MLRISPALRPVMPILIGASLMLTLTMGLRQSLGLFMPSIASDAVVTVTQFTLAISIQNLCWWRWRWRARPCRAGATGR